MERSLPVLALAAVFALTACGGGSTGVAVPQTATARTSATPMVTPTPTAPTALTKEEAAATYLRLVGPPNRAVIRLRKYVNRHASGGITAQYLRDVRRLSKVKADRAREFSIALMEQVWPVEVRPTIRSLVKELTREQSSLRAMSKARTGADFLDAINSLGGADKGAAELLRQQLGLPERTG